MRAAPRNEPLSRRVRRELAEREHQEHKKQLRQIESEAKAARAIRKAKLLEARERCNVGREKAKMEAEAAYAIALELARAAKRATKAAEQSRCHLDRQSIRDEAAAAILVKKKERAELVRHREALRRLESHSKARQPARSSAKERKSESDGEVLNNVEPQFHALFRRVKRHIKAGPHISRTEAFQHYLEEHPGEAAEAVQRDVDRQMAEEQRRQGDRATRAPREVAGVPRSRVGPQVKGRRGMRQGRVIGLCDILF